MQFFVAVGDKAEFQKTIRESDLLAFSEITGDRDPIHVDEAYAAKSVFGKRIAHGALVMGLLSTTASMISRRAVERGAKGVSVSLGYDRIRFPRPVLAGETLTARYTLGRWDPAKRRTISAIAVTAADGTVVAAGEHVMAWIMPAAPASGGSA